MLIFTVTMHYCFQLMEGLSGPVIATDWQVWPLITGCRPCVGLSPTSGNVVGLLLNSS